MGLRPTLGNENRRRRRESGGPVVGSGTRWIPACAGMTRPWTMGGSRTLPTSPIRVNDTEGAIFGGAGQLSRCA